MKTRTINIKTDQIIELRLNGQAIIRILARDADTINMDMVATRTGSHCLAYDYQAEYTIEQALKNDD